MPVLRQASRSSTVRTPTPIQSTLSIADGMAWRS